jgi:hypothetical protein
VWAGFIRLLRPGEVLLVMNFHRLKEVSRTGEEENGSVLQVIQCCLVTFIGILLCCL